MKTIYAVLQYSAMVPDDMDKWEIERCFREKLEKDHADIRFNVEGYPDEREAEPIFQLDDLMVTESYKLTSE